MASKETKENIKASRYYDDHGWYSLISKSYTINYDNYRKQIRTFYICSVLKLNNQNT